MIMLVSPKRKYLEKKGHIAKPLKLTKKNPENRPKLPQKETIGFQTTNLCSIVQTGRNSFRDFFGKPSYCHHYRLKAGKASTRSRYFMWRKYKSQELCIAFGVGGMFQHQL